MRRLTLGVFGVAYLVAAGWSLAGNTEGLRQPPPFVGMHESEAAAKRALLERAQLAKSWVPALAPSTVDALHYRLQLTLDLEREVVSGTVEVDLAAVEDGLSTVELDADQGLRILSVVLLEDLSFPYDNPLPLSFIHTDDRLAVALPRPLATGERVRLLVSYGGRAGRWGDGVNWEQAGGAGSPVVYTFAEPFGARVWWPCNDRPDDKATVELTVTAPASLLVTSNGLEVSRVDNGDGTATTHWASRYPVATYLVVMNASDYVYSEQSYTALDGSTMPVVLYAYPALVAQAEQDLASTPDMITALAHAFGEYPFVDEKFGNCLAEFGGGMEHQTLTTFSAYYVGASTAAEWLNVHELGHQWWGDWVTCADWKDLWLNEGFATYAEQVWYEHLGPTSLADYLAASDNNGYFLGPVYDNPVLFSITIYDKGGWVLRMLRHVIGDDAFFAGLASYRAAAGGGGSTEQLEAAMEEAAGSELDWFFDEWVFGVNRPRYQYSWSEVAGPTVRLVVRQLQTNAPLFRMPLDVRITTPAGTVDRVVWAEAEAEQSFNLPVAASPTAVEVDPDHQVLCEIGPTSAPDLDLGPLYPDSFATQALLVGETDTVTVPVTNLGGSELVVSSITPSLAGGFELVSPTQWPVSVAPGATQEVEIRFRARSAGQVVQPFEITSNDPSHDGVSRLRISATALLWAQPYLVAPTHLDFGVVPVGGAEEQFVPVSNPGGSDLTLTGSLSGAGFSLLTTIPERIAPGQTVEVGVRFSPIVVGPAVGALVIASNDPYVPYFTANLTGEGQAAPRLVVEPAAVLFGVIAEPATRTVAVANAGDADLVVTEVATAAPFDLPVPWQLPLTLAPGESAELGIRLSPGFDGEVQGALLIRSNDPSLGLATVPLAGRSVTGAPAGWTIPAVAHSAGLGGAAWESDLYLLNPTATDLAVDLAFLPADAAVPDLTVSLPAGQQRVVADVVTAMGRSGTGGLELTASHTGLVATSVTSAAATTGSYGQQVAAVSPAAALSCAEQAFLVGLAGNDGFHTNLGVTNPGTVAVAVDFELHAATGEALGTVTLQVPAGGFAQRTDVFSGLTEDLVRAGYAVVSCTGEAALFTAYASVVDDASHDPTLVAPAIVEPGSALDDLLPAVASNPGLGGTFWRSDVTVLNTGATSAEVLLELHPRGGGETVATTVEVGAGTTVFLPDVVASATAGGSGSGWLGVTSAASGLLVASRTYNDDPAGTYGQDVPAVSVSALVGTSDTVVVPALRSDTGFRTNLGIASKAAVETTVHATARRDDGALIGELEVTVPAGALVQLDRVLSESLGYSGRAWMTLSSTDSGAAYTAYASVVDEATGDPVFVPAVRVGE